MVDNVNCAPHVYIHYIGIGHIKRFKENVIEDSRKKKVPTQVKHENTFKLKSLNPKKGISNNGIRNFKYLCE